MKTVKVEKHSSVNDGIRYSEIGQSQNTQQAILKREHDGSFSRMTGFVKCRDFLVDSYSFQLAKKDFGIYSFTFKGSSVPLDWSGCYIQMHFADDKSKENFLKHVSEIIHPIEKANGYDRTEILQIEKSNDLVAAGDKKWLQNCLSFSFWSLLLRVCCYDFDASKDWITEFGKKSWTDSKYIASIPRKTLDKVLADLSLIKTDSFCGFDPNKESVGTIHHNSGFISVFGWHTEINPDMVKTNKHWQEIKKRGLETKVA
jgi:hypothetical protein